MAQDQDDLRKILLRLERLDAHLDELKSRMDALEQKSHLPADVASAASLETYESEVTLTEGISEEWEVREAFAAPDEPPPSAEPPQLPVSAQSPAVKPPPMPQMPAEPVPPAPVSMRTADEIAAGKSPQPAPYIQSAPGTVFPRPKPAAPKESLEMRIASVWLPWIGLLFLALAAGFLAREYARGPVGKVVFAYAVSFALIAVGLWKERKYTRWARPVLAGGLAFSYFTSYAMGFVEPMRLLDSLGLKLAVLAANLALIFGVAQWKRSEVIAGTALVLGYVTTGVVGNESAAFSSSLTLSVIAVIFLWLNQWFVSTAIAAAATYVAHLYLWQAMPDSGRTQAESFWFHGLYLSLYFVVFTAAGLVGRSVARADLGKESRLSTDNPAGALSRVDVLATLTQVNIGAYLAGMIALLKLTEVYWDQSWLFFLPMVAVFGGIGLLFSGLRVIQNMYLTAAVVSFTLGVAALLSPMWLPIFMAFQAVALLWAAQAKTGKSGIVWQLLSLASLAIALLYISSEGQIDVLRLSTGADLIDFPWWTIAGVTLMTLAYAVIWEKRLRHIETGLGIMVPGAVAFAAAAIWNMTYNLYSAKILIPAFALAVPVVASVLVLLRVRWLSLFLLLAAPAAVIQLWQAGDDAIRNMNHLPLLVGLTGLAAGLLVEKRGTGLRRWDEWIWRGLYVWAPILIVTDLLVLEGRQLRLILLAAAFAATTAAGWSLRSSALAKSAYVILPAIFIAGLALAHHGEQPVLTAAAVAAIICVSVFPVATRWWRQRTGDRYPALNHWGQAAAVFVAGFILLFAAHNMEWNKVLVSAAWALVASCFAVLGLFPVVAWVVVVYMVMAAVGLVGLASDVWGGNYGKLDLGTTTIECVAAVLLIVIAERVLRVLPNRLSRSLSGNHLRDWISEMWQRQFTAVVAISTLVMAIIALRLLPDLQNFYFTGAIVGAAFVWIVFGFWFNESAYRKSGFAVLCFGLIKGLIWDLWSLKEPIYRVISGAIVGLLAISASFLYTRFRGRVSNTEDAEPPGN